MRIINYIIPIFTIFMSCADSSQTTTLSDASGLAENLNTRDVSDDDFADIPTAVSGGFRSLKCDYDYPNMGQSSGDIRCSARDDEGDLSDILSLKEAQVFISAPEELTSQAYYCENFSVCHWRIRVENRSANPNMGALMSAVQVGVSAVTRYGNTIKIKAKAEPTIRQDQKKQNDCVNGICLGDFNHSCVTTCQLRSMAHDDQRAQAQHSMAFCEAMRQAPYYPNELDNKIYDNNGKDMSITSIGNLFTKPQTEYMNEYVRNSSSGCYLIYDAKQEFDFVRWYYYTYSEIYDPQDHHPQMRRFCYCK